MCIYISYTDKCIYIHVRVSSYAPTYSSCNNSKALQVAAMRVSAVNIYVFIYTCIYVMYAKTY